MTTSLARLSQDAIRAAQMAHVHWGIPASVSLAQYALESDWGEDMPKNSNNPFGIKARPNEPFVNAWTHECIHGEWVKVQAAFRAFESLEDAFDAHASLLATRLPNVHAMQLLPNVDAFVMAMAAKYATDPHYGQHLLALIHGPNNLAQFDSFGLRGPQTMKFA